MLLERWLRLTYCIMRSPSCRVGHRIFMATVHSYACAYRCRQVCMSLDVHECVYTWMCIHESKYAWMCVCMCVHLHKMKLDAWLRDCVHVRTCTSKARQSRDSDTALPCSANPFGLKMGAHISKCISSSTLTRSALTSSIKIFFGMGAPDSSKLCSSKKLEAHYAHISPSLGPLLPLSPPFISCPLSHRTLPCPLSLSSLSTHSLHKRKGVEVKIQIVKSLLTWLLTERIHKNKQKP